MQRLSVVVPISLLLIFVLLFDAFKSFRMAALILINAMRQLFPPRSIISWAM